MKRTDQATSPDQFIATERFIQAVRDASDLESVAAGYGHLTVQASRSLAVCPRHNDTAPSLSLDLDEQVGRCWWCLATGDVFWLVMEHERICFRDAVRMLAGRAGITEPAGLSWRSSQTRRPHGTTAQGSRPAVSALKSLEVARRLRI